jgi:prepilin-type N-terminal cleavage/methylation domain-containing protein
MCIFVIYTQMILIQRKNGLTILELLVAIALLGIVGAAAVSSHQRMLAAWRLAAGARQLVIDLELTRIRAISENTGQRLRFAVDAPAYTHEREDDSGRYFTFGKPHALPEGVQVAACTARGSTVTFRPRGHATTYGTITLRGSNGEQRRIIVDVAGRARVE